MLGLMFGLHDSVSENVWLILGGSVVFFVECRFFMHKNTPTKWSLGFEVHQILCGEHRLQILYMQKAPRYESEEPFTFFMAWFER
ncbi:hypothetical protein DVH26_11470 [Paenibacillus sp. H1-7]|nr:hypothetical protein DVH26_11470 [Paenibacillus sp. H1-7]